jgi:hypothetical protein
VDQNTTVVFPAPLMSTIQELGAFLAREQAAGITPAATTSTPAPAPTTPVRSTSPASTGSAGGERQPTNAAFNTDYNGASPAHPR